MAAAGGSGPGAVRGWRVHTGIAAVLSLAAAQPACGLVTSDVWSNDDSALPPGADAGTDAADAAVPDVSLDEQTDDGLPACATAVENPVLASEAIAFPTGRPRVFYSWTTEEQIAELRAGAALFNRSEREGLGRGYALTALAEFASSGTRADQELARLIGEDLFINLRYAWTNPWATRLGWPGEDYGNQLIRIVLEPEAWIVVFDGWNLQVLDANDQEVPIEDALAQPERIGALYFLRGERAGGPVCGTFAGGDGGYREFVLGNLAMVEEWSVGTETILTQLDTDIGALEELIAVLSACQANVDTAMWNADVVCYWQGQWPAGALRPYEDALALPSELYLPTMDHLQSLVDTLRADRFEPDPLVVDPNESP